MRQYTSFPSGMVLPLCGLATVSRSRAFDPQIGMQIKYLRRRFKAGCVDG